ncbi:nuclease SbcCD subunit D [Fictibacillus macauensis ZFHKF-1]|uniref:Nuclease SbcCD subunit D n=1 Tax=Fictibacillus macauensis ZFHKF-1 TaxID=1196324 RepID=I8AFY9_9BACL|nr:exonuclease subunit SbcD [Fictibacillus macauensis]EIT84537.1 nuclease SbcCD subunit D [Fictibacillus macauensis ZFHKF-1]
MRLLHTADWHLGRTLEGRDRLAEQQQFLDELVEIADTEQADAILMAGDVFDTVNPPAAAEEMFYDAMARLSKGGTRPVIAIAGNHDHPDRLMASSPLASTHGVTLIGLPKMELFRYGIERTNEQLSVCALPYPSESRLKEMLSQSGEEIDLRNQYDEWVGRYFQQMAAQFSSSDVNVAMSHLYVAGSKESDSERPVHIGGAYTVAAETLPLEAQYVALGHLHRPQRVKRAKTEARYAGSPLAYSFSEAGYTKSVVMVDLHPKKEAIVTEIPLSCGRPLLTYGARSVSDVFRYLENECPVNAWVDLSVHVSDRLTMEEIQQIRKAHKGIIHIKPVFTELTEDVLTHGKKLSITELFHSFYETQTGGAKPDEHVMNLFLELIGEEEGSDAS